MYFCSGLWDMLQNVKLPTVHTFMSAIDFYVCTSVALESSVVPGSHCWKEISVPMSHILDYCFHMYYCYYYYYYYYYCCCIQH